MSGRSSKAEERFLLRHKWTLLLGVSVIFGVLTHPYAATEQPARELGEPPEGFFDQPPLPPDAPMPGRNPRDFDGTWYHADPWETELARTMYGRPIPFTPKGKKISTLRKASKAAGKPMASAGTTCRPAGLPTQLEINYPFTILQAEDQINFVFQAYHGAWTIRMNQPHRTDGKSTYMGDSVGHWEGDTLVVETINFSVSHWLDAGGLPFSKNGRMVHRIRKTFENDRWALEIKLTITDPEMYRQEWSIVREWLWRPEKVTLGEYNCEMQTGEPDALAIYGVVPDVDVEKVSAE